MAATSKQDQDLTSAEQDLPSTSAKDQDKTPAIEVDLTGQEGNDGFETGSAVITGKKIQVLRNNKKSAKTRLTKAKKQLTELLEPVSGALSSKNAVRRAVNKINSESSVIEKIIISLKELYALNGEMEETDTTIETLDKELDEIMASVDLIIEAANKHLQERLDNGEAESVLLSYKSHKSELSVTSSYIKQKKLEAEEANERLLKVEEEQRQKEQELEKLAAELQLTKQRTEEARKIAELNQLRAEEAERESGPLDRDSVQNLQASTKQVPNLLERMQDSNLHEADKGKLVQRTSPIKLKGVDLPKFSGEDKADYEPWKAAFMTIVDRLDVPVGEKMLRLQSSLTGRAQTLVKDLGYSLNAYERAKAKLEKKYGGERRLQIKHLTALRGWQKVRTRNLEDMEDFQAVLERVLIALQDCGPGQELQGQSLNLTAKEKLSEEDVQAYKHWLIDHSLEDSFESLVEWVELRVQIMEEAKEETSGFGKRKFDRREERRTGVRGDRARARGFATRSKSRGCIVDTCRQDHPPWVCRAFKELPVQKRKELIGNTGRCYRCLAAGHHSRDCPNAKRCGVDGCLSTSHSRYLHENTPQHAADRSQSQLRAEAPLFRQEEQPHSGARPPHAAAASTSGPAPVSSHLRQQTYNTSHVENVSLMILPALISNGKKELRVNVMLDPCSTSSYISEDAAEELELQGQGLNLTIAGTGGTEIKTRSRRVELSVANLDGTFSSPLQAHVLDNIAGDTPAIHWSELKKKWPHLSQVPFESVSRRRQIDVMIGSDHPVFHHVLKEACGNQPNDPVARLTNLGWVCFGPTLVEEFRRNSRSHFTRTYRSSQVNQQPPPDDILRRFWELESLGIKDETEQLMTAEERAATAQAAESLEFKNGRYKIGIPWKEGEPKLTNNYEGALVRLKSQEKSLKRKGPEVMNAYCKIFEDYEKKDYIRKVPKSEAEEQWFLPHFPVVREDKVTTKVRVVFDAAMKHDGKSLNSAIRPGPKLQRELVDVLTRFRRAPVALSGDISEMFLQVELQDKDRQYHRFLWRNFDTSREPDIYEFRRLLFGNTASPFCSQYVLHTHAQTHASDFPEAANTVDDSMYVDDVLDSCETTQSAQHLRRQLSDLLAMAGFKLRKWSSNEPVVIEDIPIEDRLPALEINKEELPKTKTLGVMWEAERDVFTFQVEPPDDNKEPTKRNVLSAIASLFDPLQFLAPFTVRAKILMQEIWMAGVDWDDVLPDDLRAKWETWVSELPQLSNVAVPRCLRLANPASVDLHFFSDASNNAFASAAYLVCRYLDNTSSSRLIASKCRVAPVKAMTIPRLELMGAVLSSRLAQNILKVITVDRIVFWTDSENVWYWVRNQSREFKPFVANRIGEIQRTTSPEQWRHIPGTMNPADLPTRGLTATVLAESEVWMEGPAFLKDDESTWPAALPSREDAKQAGDCERRTTTRTHVTKSSASGSIDPSHFSNLKRLVRVTGWVQRFLTNCRLPKELQRKDRTLLSAEMSAAETFWIKQAQAQAFPGGENEGSLTRLNPKSDGDGLLRMDGRLRFADDLPYNTRHPILLPKNHPVTRLVVVDAHERLGHGSGVEHVLTELRSRFWIVKGRRVVRSITEACAECRRRFTTKTGSQMMAPLPRSRLQSSLRAFERVGVDYGGPYLTKQGRGKTRAKRYLCLFTCLATRAVHLEMSYSLDTDSFINAFTRMTSRRGTPTYVISDNGTNFVGAERELRELVEAFDPDRITHETTKHHHIDWKFNPPSAPHFGGVFEAMIKSAKKAIKAILGDADVNDEELHTAICGAERLLNSRPITYVSSDAQDLSPLTPSHFLVGEMGGSFAPEALDREEVFNPKKRWHRVQQLLGQFWKRWRKEFLPSLNVRKKWFHPRHNLKEGDVVLIVEPNANRGEWPLGRVMEAYPGDDGLVRVVRVKAKNKEYVRPVHRLCPLEYAEDNPEE